jgi:hypothetical protein
MLNLAPHRTYPTTDISQIDRDFFTGAKLLSTTNAKASSRYRGSDHRNFTQKIFLK